MVMHGDGDDGAEYPLYLTQDNKGLASNARHRLTGPVANHYTVGDIEQLLEGFDLISSLLKYFDKSGSVRKARSQNTWSRACNCLPSSTPIWSLDSGY